MNNKHQLTKYTDLAIPLLTGKLVDALSPDRLPELGIDPAVA